MLLFACFHFFALIGLHASGALQVLPERLPEAFESALPAGYQAVKPPEEVALAKGGSGWFMQFVNERWSLKSPPQQGGFSPPTDNMPEGEKLQKYDHFLDYVDVWLIPKSALSDGKLDPKECVTRLRATNEFYQELAYLGDEDGYACVVDAPISTWVHLQRQLQFSGGDDPIEAAIRGFSIDDKGSSTRGGSEQLIKETGIKSFPYIKKAVAEGKTGLSWAIVTAAEWNDPAVDRWLEQNLTNPHPEIASAVRYGFILHPEKRWEKYYLKCIKESVGTERALEVLDALAAIKSSRVPECADLLMNRPYWFSDYYSALKIKREFQGSHVSEKLLQAENDIKKYGYKSGPDYNQKAVDRATQVILDSKEYDAEFLMGLELAGCAGKGDSSPLEEAGARILAQLPENKGIKTAQFLADQLKDNFEAKQLLKNLARFSDGK